MPIPAVPPEVIRLFAADLDCHDRESVDVRLAKFLQASRPFLWPMHPVRGR